MNDREYRDREIGKAMREIGALDRDPLQDRQAARAEWREALRSTPEIVGERVGCLLAGNYGYGSYCIATDKVLNPIKGGKFNLVAFLGQMIAALEWRCPGGFARQAWNQLTKEEQERVNGLIQDEIDNCKAESAE